MIHTKLKHNHNQIRKEKNFSKIDTIKYIWISKINFSCIETQIRVCRVLVYLPCHFWDSHVSN